VNKNEVNPSEGSRKGSIGDQHKQITNVTSNPDTREVTPKNPEFIISDLEERLQQLAARKRQENIDNVTTTQNEAKKQKIDLSEEYPLLSNAQISQIDNI